MARGFGFTQGKFQSTLPAGEATSHVPRYFTKFLISIHASRGGSDPPLFLLSWQMLYFNPRFPRGKRPMAKRCRFRQLPFQSTLPAREATQWRRDADSDNYHFNPRFPRGKRRILRVSINLPLADFNPRFPRGKRPIAKAFIPFCFHFNPRFPRGKRHLISFLLACLV